MLRSKILTCYVTYLKIGCLDMEPLGEALFCSTCAVTAQGKHTGHSDEDRNGTPVIQDCLRLNRHQQKPRADTTELRAEPPKRQESTQIWIPNT